MTCTRRNHIDCRVMKSDYKKPGHKKPGLCMEDFFVFFCRMAWTGRRAWSLKKILCTLNSSLLLHFARVESEHVETVGWEQDETTWMGWDKTTGMGRDETTGTG